MVLYGIFLLSFVTVVSCANVHYPHPYPTDEVISWKRISSSGIPQDHDRRKRQVASLQQSLQNLQRVQQQQSRSQRTTAQYSDQINDKQESSNLEGFYGWKELTSNSASSYVQEPKAVTEDVSGFSNAAGFSSASVDTSYNNNRGSYSGSNGGISGSNNNQGLFSGSYKGTSGSNNYNQGSFPVTSRYNYNNQGSSSGSNGGTIPSSYNNRGSYSGNGGTAASSYNNRDSGTGFRSGSTGSSTSKQGSQQPEINLRSPAFVESNMIAGRFGGPQITEQHTEDAACIRGCQSVGNYSPVCGTDNVSYTNEQKLKCAQKCGRPVEVGYSGVCAVTV